MQHRTAIAVLLGLVIVDLLATGVAAQSNSPQTRANIPLAQTKSKGKLSFRLDALARSASLRAASRAEQASALSLPEKGPGSLMHDAKGNLQVEIRMADLSTVQQQALRAAGAEIVHVSDRYKTVTARVEASRLTSVADLAAVQSVHEVLEPMRRGSGAPPSPSAAQVSSPSASTCLTGIAVSGGDTQLNAASARSTYGIDGTGVTIGILSDSYDVWTAAPTRAITDVASGDLPGTGNTCGFTTPVSVLAETSATNTADEGRAMLQIAHDLAPGATLKFATAWVSLTSFADNIRALRTAGADIIADDIFYMQEPFFQEGPVNVAISDVVSSGALYFTAAGNENIKIGSNYVASYEAPTYRPTTCPSFVSSYKGPDCHDFDPSGGVNPSDAITLAPGGAVEVDFQYNEPWYGVTDDLDIYLLDASNNVVASSYEDNIYGTKMPWEEFHYANSSGSTQTYRIVINRYSGSGAPRLKFVFIQGTSGLSSVQYNTSSSGDIVGPAIFGHSATRYGFSVAAVPYYNSSIPESYSSRGPAAHYYGPVVGTTPALALAAPLTLQQPDFAATDGGCTTFFYPPQSGGCYRFYGTSAAAPHAAAVTALLKQRASLLGMPFTWGIARFALTSTASQVSGGDGNSVGFGLLNALAAAAELPNIKFSNLPLIMR